MFLFMITGCASENDSPIREELKELVISTENDDFPVVTWEETEKMNKEALEFRDVLSKDFSIETWDVSKSSINTPAGILCREKDILVIDKDECNITILDKAGNPIKKVGEIGSGELQFQKPTAITSYDDTVYVVDAGNKRIQVLDDELNYIDSIALPSSDKDTQSLFTSIAIDQAGSIFVCGDFLYQSSLYCIAGAEDEAKVVGEHFYGSLTERNGEVFAINKGLIYVEVDDEEMGVRGGHNGLWKVKASGMERLFELPTGLAIGTFIYKDEVIAVSTFGMTLMRFDSKTGNYIESLAFLDDLSPTPYLDTQDDRFYITDGDKGLIYVVK
ncbi:DNA-binding beta-propeller fold protein YncE [Lachnospiraceae bacterium PF1-22]